MTCPVLVCMMIALSSSKFACFQARVTLAILGSNRFTGKNFHTILRHFPSAVRPATVLRPMAGMGSPSAPRKTLPACLPWKLHSTSVGSIVPCFQGAHWPLHRCPQLRNFSKSLLRALFGHLLQECLHQHPTAIPSLQCTSFLARHGYLGPSHPALCVPLFFRVTSAHSSPAVDSVRSCPTLGGQLLQMRSFAFLPLLPLPFPLLLCVAFPVSCGCSHCFCCASCHWAP